MFIGHFALGFAAKRVAPRVSLAVLFGAAQFADLLWPVLLAFGIEQVRIDPGNTRFTPLDFVSYPWSHSLLMLLVWGALLGTVYFAFTKNSRGAWIIAALVVSHWFLDWVTHLPDMPVWPGGPKYGLGMWKSLLLTQAVELAMWVAGFAIYARVTRAKDEQGKWGFRILVLLLYVAYLASSFSGPPPSVKAIWITAMLGTLVTLILAWWADLHRESVTTT